MGSKELVCYKKSHYMGSVKTCLLQECTLFGVNKDLSVTRMHVIWGQTGHVCYKNVRYLGSKGLVCYKNAQICCQKGLVCYKNARYFGSIMTCLLQEGTLYGVKKDLSVTRMHVIEDNKDLFVTRTHLIWGQ